MSGIDYDALYREASAPSKAEPTAKPKAAIDYDALYNESASNRGGQAKTEPKKPEPGVVDRVVSVAKKVLEPSADEPAAAPPAGPRRGGTRAEVKPYVAGDERAPLPPEMRPGGSTLDVPNPDQQNEALIDQRGAPLAQDTFEKLKRSLAAMPREQRQAQLSRSDLPGWMASAMATASRQIDREDKGAATTGVTTPFASQEARADTLMKGGMRGDVAGGVAQNEALRGGVSTIPAQARPGIDTGLTTDQEQAAKTEGADMQGRSVGARGLYMAGQGLKQATQGTMAMALRAAGDEEGAKLYEAEGAKNKVRAESADELATMRQRAGEMGIVNTGPADYIERMATGGMNSVGQMIPGMAAGAAAGLATGNPVIGARVAMGLMSGQVFGQEYVNGRTEGLTPSHAAGRASIMASLEYIGERYGLIPQAMKALTGKAAAVPLEELPQWAERAVQAMEKRGLFSAPVGAVVRGLAGEQIGEQITGAGQYLLDGTKMGLDRPISVQGFLENARDTAVQTLIATGVMQMAGAGAGVLMGRKGGRHAGDLRRAGEAADQVELARRDAAATLPPATPPGAGAIPEMPSDIPGSADAPLDAGELLGTPLDEQAHGAATSPTNDRPEPTQAQKEAGNYPKGHIRLSGLDISIENPQGSTRRGVDQDGTAWENQLQSHYGYIRGTEGNDGDHVDTFIKAGTPLDYQGPVFVIDQRDPKTGAFDEHKVMLGFDSPDEANAAYHANYHAGWNGLGYLSGMDMPAFKAWVASGNHKAPFSAGFKETPSDKPDVAGTPPGPVGTSDGTSPVAGGSGGNLRPDSDVGGGSVRATPAPEPGSGTVDAVGSGDQPNTALSDTPDFETTFPRPQPNPNGKGSMFEGLDDDPAYLIEAIRGVHQETGFGIQVDVATAQALRDGLANGTDPATGKAAKPERLQAMQSELDDVLGNIDGTLDDYAGEFGDAHRKAFQAVVVPELEELRKPVERKAEPAPPAAGGSKRADALKKLGGILGAPEAAPAPVAAAVPSKDKVKPYRQAIDEAFLGRQAATPEFEQLQAAGLIEPLTKAEAKEKENKGRTHKLTQEGERLRVDILKMAEVDLASGGYSEESMAKIGRRIDWVMGRAEKPTPVVGDTFENWRGGTSRIAKVTPSAIGTRSPDGKAGSMPRTGQGYDDILWGISESRRGGNTDADLKDPYAFAQRQVAERQAETAAENVKTARKTKTKKAAKAIKTHPSTVNGSKLLAEISRQKNGLAPSLMKDLSIRKETGLLDKNGKNRIEWFNPPAGKGIGGLFRQGGILDMSELAQWMEEEGYIAPGTSERDYKEASDLTRDLIKQAIAKTEPLTLDEQIAKEQADQEAERAAYYADLEAAEAEKAEELRRFEMDAYELTPAELDAQTDDDVWWDGPFMTTTGAAAMKASGLFTEQEIADAFAEEQAAQQPQDASGPTQERVRETGQDRPSGPRAPADAGAPAPRPADGPEEALTLEAQTPEALQAKADREEAAAEAERELQRVLAARDAKVKRKRNKGELDARKAAELKARADAARDGFELGQEPPSSIVSTQQAAGQGDIFDEPAPASRADEMDDESAEWERRYEELFVDPPKTTRAAETAGEPMTQADADAKLEQWRKAAQNPKDIGANSSITVLSLFDHTGVWSAPWVEAGYNVIQVDITNGQDIHDISIDALNDAGIDDADIILAAVPCTDFAASGARWWQDKDGDGRTEASLDLLRQTKAILEYFRPKVWAIENPVGRIQRIGNLNDPRLIFDPHHYGDPYTKKTLLYGNFNADLPQANVVPTEGSKIVKMSSSAKAEREVTPEGFAYAFFMANGQNFGAVDMPAETATNTPGVVIEQNGKFFVRFGDDRAAHGPIRTREAAEAYAKGPPRTTPIDPMANDFAGLDGKTLEQTITMEDGTTATLRMDAGQAMRGIEKRMKALAELRACLEGSS